MNKQVWKYVIDPSQREQKLSVPRGTKFLHVDVQRGVPCVWASVYPGEKLEDRYIYVFATGREITVAGVVHLGTFLLYEGDYVGHVFIEDDVFHRLRLMGRPVN